MHALLVSAASVVILCVVVLLSTSRRMGAACARLPGLDMIVSLLTWVPWVAISIAFGWRGLLGALCGQLLSVFHLDLRSRATASCRRAGPAHREV
jgi:hypothetical protein